MHWRLVGLAILFAACDGEMEPRVPSVLEVWLGDQQTERVNSAVPVAPAVRVLDQKGDALGGAQVIFTVSEGGGSIEAASALSDAQGIASPGRWTLGRVSGPNALSASLGGTTAVTFRATATAGAPSSLAVTAGSGQQGRVGEAVSTSPSVRVTDAFGNPTPDVEVSFVIAGGGGVIDGGEQRTDAQGVATVGAWRLGTLAGENRLDARVAGGASTTVIAQGLAGPPAVIFKHLGEGGFSQVATSITQPPVVRVADTFGNPVSGVAVSFSVGPGGGSVEPASVTSDAQGLAAATRWTLGTTAGLQTVTAAIDGGVPAVTFSVTGTAAAPAAVEVFAGQGQTAPAGSAVVVRPAAAVTDAYGNRVSGATVTFFVTSGGGSVTGATQTSNGSGVATVTAWTLGPAAGLNTLEARLATGAAVRFDATATSSSGGGGGGTDNGTFDIDLRFGAGLTASQQAVFRQAVARWQEIITGDVPGVPITLDANSCGTQPAMNERVDDLVIFASALSIDGVFGVLGRAGPCLVRSSSYLPVVGFMEFDTADLAALEANGSLMPVILHEIGHVLGIGTIWEPKGLLSGKGTTWPWFPGTRAIAAFDAAGGTTFIGEKVPVENTGGAGTREAHWRESALGTELMTGYMNAGVANPLSAVTAASLQDVGYVVNVTRADPFNLAGALLAPGAERERIPLIEQPIPPPIVVAPDGKRVPPR